MWLSLKPSILTHCPPQSPAPILTAQHSNHFCHSRPIPPRHREFSGCDSGADASGSCSTPEVPSNFFFSQLTYKQHFCTLEIGPLGGTVQLRLHCLWFKRARGAPGTWPQGVNPGTGLGALMAPCWGFRSKWTERGVTSLSHLALSTRLEVVFLQSKEPNDFSKDWFRRSLI